jgi:hypothetical protein
LPLVRLLREPLAVDVLRDVEAAPAALDPCQGAEGQSPSAPRAATEARVPLKSSNSWLKPATWVGWMVCWNSRPRFRVRK